MVGSSSTNSDTYHCTFVRLLVGIFVTESDGAYPFTNVRLPVGISAGDIDAYLCTDARYLTDFPAICRGAAAPILVRMLDSRSYSIAPMGFSRC